MKSIAYLILVACLAGGALSAATSYHVPIDEADALAKRKKAFVLNADAGVVIVDDKDRAQAMIKLALKEQRLAFVANAVQNVYPSIYVPPLLPFESLAGAKYGLAYRSLVRANPKQLETATWDAKNGMILDEKERRFPLVRKGDVLTGTVLKSLRKYNKQVDSEQLQVHFLRGKEFSIARWPGKWYFLASVIGLGLSAFLLRFASQKELVQAKAGPEEGPEQALRTSLQEVEILLGLLHEKPDEHDAFEELLQELGEEHAPHAHDWAQSRSSLVAELGPGGFADLDAALSLEGEANPRLSAIREQLDEAQEEQVERYAKARVELLKKVQTKPEFLWSYWLTDFGVQVLERLGEVQRTHFPAFVEARPLLIARLGMGGYADIMDSFAAAERQLNRAWSAAADGVMEESVISLIEGKSALELTIRKLGAS